MSFDAPFPSRCVHIHFFVKLQNVVDIEFRAPYIFLTNKLIEYIFYQNLSFKLSTIKIKRYQIIYHNL